MEINEICYLYKTAKDKDDEIFILAQLTCSDPETIIEVLKDEGIYEENHIQRCIKCKEMYIEYGRLQICPSCRRKHTVNKRRKEKRHAR